MVSDQVSPVTYQEHMEYFASQGRVRTVKKWLKKRLLSLLCPDAATRSPPAGGDEHSVLSVVSALSRCRNGSICLVRRLMHAGTMHYSSAWMTRPTYALGHQVRSRAAKRARVHSTDLLCRIYRARDDLGQNEAERLNASMGIAERSTTPDNQQNTREMPPRTSLAAYWGCCKTIPETTSGDTYESTPPTPARDYTKAPIPPASWNTPSNATASTASATASTASATDSTASATASTASATASTASATASTASATASTASATASTASATATPPLGGSSSSSNRDVRPKLHLLQEDGLSFEDSLHHEVERAGRSDHPATALTNVRGSRRRRPEEVRSCAESCIRAIMLESLGRRTTPSEECCSGANCNYTSEEIMREMVLVRTWYLAIRNIPDGKADTIVQKLKEFLKVGEATIRILRVSILRNYIPQQGVDVVCVVTDRHRGVRKVLKEPNAVCQDLGLDGDMPETTDPVESVHEDTGQEEGDEDAGLATPFTTALKHLKGAPEEMKLNQNSDMYMDFLSQVPERNATVHNYATHIALASMVSAAFALVIKVARKYEKGDINGQGNKREIKQGLFQNLRGRPSEEQEQWLQSLSDGMSISEFKKGLQSSTRITRQATSNKLLVPRVSRDCVRRSFAVSGAVLWNSAPAEAQLFKLMCCCLIALVSNAEAERVFSCQNRIKTKTRTLLGIEQLDRLIRLSYARIPMPEFDFPATR
ncbi:hypothetical protein Bbelb_284030 [Branchiostoma belcheri]|nr:hypothetical protein Bbelb_284030 [Branchiostoma belcheri]